MCCIRLPDNQECHELRYKRLRKGLKDVTKMQVDNHRHSSSSEAKNAERSYVSRVAEPNETSATSHGAGIAYDAMLLGPSGTQQQQQQMARGSSSLQQRLAELSQSLSSSIDTHSASTINTDLAALLSVITAAVNRPVH